MAKETKFSFHKNIYIIRDSNKHTFFSILVEGYNKREALNEYRRTAYPERKRLPKGITIR